LCSADRESSAGHLEKVDQQFPENGQLLPVRLHWGYGTSIDVKLVEINYLPEKNAV